ncbi:hypothetical protein HPB51_011448 [Rhipicephalus microplus]|uniref:Tick transposon n=1 Tax=Rhipicephalus microplus TaxID=6941 RepID=A0A9J6DV75_RHIMP|nr:hypothetical protein HPB51_011448 [Rhipicephalus microplus]
MAGVVLLSTLLLAATSVGGTDVLRENVSLNVDLLGVRLLKLHDDGRPRRLVVVRRRRRKDDDTGSGHGKVTCDTMAQFRFVRLFYFVQALVRFATCPSCHVLRTVYLMPTDQQSNQPVHSDSDETPYHLMTFNDYPQDASLHLTWTAASTKQPVSAQAITRLGASHRFSGHGKVTCDTMAQFRFVRLFYFVQVSNKCSLFAKRTSNRCTLLFPCPHALCTAYDEYVHVLSKLLCCGDIESNPGPDEWQKEVLTMLKELKAETGRLAQGQVDISANVATAQKSFEEGFVAMNTRILKIEAQCDKIDDVKERLILAEEAVKTFEQTSTVMSSRLDVIEDRARRDNLIFHGIPDAKESWIQTEEKIVSLLMQHVDPNITDDVIERAHRLGGSYQENRCRPVIVKFSRFKLRQQVLFKRATFKGNVCRKVIRRVGADFNDPDLQYMLRMTRYPKVLGERRIKNTTAVIILLDGYKVPNYVYCGPMMYHCTRYKRQTFAATAAAWVTTRTPARTKPKKCATNAVMNSLAKPTSLHHRSAHCAEADRTCRGRYQIPYLVRRRRQRRRRGKKQ